MLNFSQNYHSYHNSKNCQTCISSN